MIVNFAIIDDDPTDTEYVTRLVSHWAECTGHTVCTYSYLSAEEFLFHYEDEKDYDILLLDIEMGDMNGVELAKKIRQDEDAVQIVFITGFPDFMAEGYEVSALHYLMKPVLPEKLYGVLDKAVGNIEKQEKRLHVTYDRQTNLIPYSQILFIESQKQYVVIYTTNDDYRMKESLSNIEKQLDEYFFKCHRSFLVNLRHVKQIKGNCLMLKNGREVPISRGMAEQIGKKIIKLF